MTDNPEAMLPVTQEDREAAASILVGQLTERHGSQNWITDGAMQIRAGKHDDSTEVRAFARHRINSTTDKDARIARLDLALARCLDLLAHIRKTGAYPPNGDAEALAELDEHIASGDAARQALKGRSK